MAGNPFRSQCLGHRPYRFRQNIGCVSLSHRPIDDRATHAACRCACAVYLAVKGARGRCGQNLEQPLEGIAAQCEAQGLPVPKIAVATRSGDTTAQERRRIASHPPDILVTTPESLYLLLTSKAGRILGTVDTVIVDEIHAVAGTKRGAHLAVSLERLENLVAESRKRDAIDADADEGGDAAVDAGRGDRHMQRIGLSATVNPPEKAARFLGGGQPVTIVNPGGRPAMDLRMIEPLENMRDLQSVNAKQRVGGVDAERSAPHISGVTPAMQRLAERRALCRWMIEMFLPLLGTILMRVMSSIPPRWLERRATVPPVPFGPWWNAVFWMRFSRTALHWCSLIRVVWPKSLPRA